LLLIDTHCHLEEDEFREDVESVINRAVTKEIHIITSAIKKVNWNDKAQNLQEIAQEINIRIDSLAFFDDNPYERDKVEIARQRGWRGFDKTKSEVS